MITTKYIQVKTQFEGIHCWPDAPEEVAFLRNMHRHMFHVRLKAEVYHDDRELEFILVKRALDQYIQKSFGFLLGSQSCEMLAEQIVRWFQAVAPGGEQRALEVEVSEDGENSATVSVVHQQGVTSGELVDAMLREKQNGIAVG